MFLSFSSAWEGLELFETLARFRSSPTHPYNKSKREVGDAMNATFTKILQNGPLFLDQSGLWHVERTSNLDVEGKLLNGRPSEFGYLSAIREVADVEMDGNFHSTREAYIGVAKIVEALADCAGSEFAEQYRVVARLVRQYANKL